VTGDDVFYHFIHVEVFVAGADASERFVGTKPAAAATTDVVFAKKRALRAGELHEQVSHGGIGIDGDGWIHIREQPKVEKVIRKRPGSARASRAGDDASSSRTFPEGDFFGVGAVRV
jgi:hypothetical protein